MKSTWRGYGLWADRCVYIWDAATARLLYKLPGHEGTVNEVRMRGDGTGWQREGRIAEWSGSVALGRRARDSRRATGSSVTLVIPLCSLRATQAVFHPTEPIVASAGSDKKVFLGELD